MAFLLSHYHLPHLSTNPPPHSGVGRCFKMGGGAPIVIAHSCYCVSAYRISPNGGTGLYFLPGPFSTRPLNEAGLYTGPASIYACSFCSSFLRVLFCAMYSSMLESDIVHFRLNIMETSVAVRPGFELNFPVVTCTHG